MSTVCARCSTLIGDPAEGLCPRCLFEVAIAEPEPDEDVAFRILTLLGRSAHGTTYLAEREDEPGLLSLKIIDGDEAAVAATRLSPIRRAILDCRHASLVRVHHIGLGAPVVLAAEYLRGRPLGGGDRAHFAGWFAAAASALQALHDRGIAHRNLHPQNVLVLSGIDSRLCLLDVAQAGPILSPADGLEDVRQLGALMRHVLTGKDAGGDLPRIVDRALRAGEPGGYPTLAALADDLGAL
jgi:hypothetical protein